MRIESMFSLYSQGMKMDALAQLAGVSATTVRRRLTKYDEEGYKGISRRNSEISRNNFIINMSKDEQKRGMALRSNLKLSGVNIDGIVSSLQNISGFNLSEPKQLANFNRNLGNQDRTNKQLISFASNFYSVWAGYIQDALEDASKYTLENFNYVLQQALQLGQVYEDDDNDDRISAEIDRLVANL